MRKTASVFCIVLAFLCGGAQAEPLPQFGEGFVYALGSLAAAKIQPKLRVEAIKEAEIRTVYQDFIMLYRRETIKCGGLLDRIAPSLTKFASTVHNLERFGDSVLVIDQLRKMAPEIDVEVERFAVENFASVVDQFGKGEWAIPPACKSSSYKAEYAK